MTALHGMPSGRAGRSWLLQRLATAERGWSCWTGRRVLQREQCRHHLRAERTAAEAHACTAAETWLLRGALLGGRRAVRDAVPAAPATVDVTWAVVMGVRYPGGATVAAARPDDGAPTASNTALGRQLRHSGRRSRRPPRTRWRTRPSTGSTPRSRRRGAGCARYGTGGSPGCAARWPRWSSIWRSWSTPRGSGCGGPRHTARAHEGRDATRPAGRRRHRGLAGRGAGGGGASPPASGRSCG